jgi:hypothetical protein
VRILKSLVAVSTLGCWSVANAQTAATTSPAPTDVYHVQFAKALPGQAAALEKNLKEQDPKNPMASHYILLRHQEGADWDYCLIQHLGPRATVEITPPPPSATNATPAGAWHEDTFVAGPSWAEFQKSMDFAGSGTSVYVVSVHRPAPGHRTQLQEFLSRPDPGTKVAGRLVLPHLEGGAWTFLSIDRYNSWQDFGADRMNAAGGKGWLEAREHSAFHTDTIADRVR